MADKTVEQIIKEANLKEWGGQGEHPEAITQIEKIYRDLTPDQQRTVREVLLGMEPDEHLMMANPNEEIAERTFREGKAVISKERISKNN